MSSNGEPLSASPRLAVFWMLYMGGMGIFFPYAGLYFREHLGFSPGHVGLVLAAVPLASLLCQPAWGVLADRTGSRRMVLAVLAGGASLAALGLAPQRNFLPVLLGTAAFAAFHTAVLPMATSVTLASVGSERFGPVRMWGTLGFLLAVVSFPHLARSPVQQSGGGTGPDLALLFPWVAVLAFAASLAAFALPRAPALAVRSLGGQAARLLAQRPIQRLVLVVVAIHFFIQGPIFLFPLYVTSRGGDAETVSRMWLLMLLLEIPLIAFSGHTLRRFGARGLLHVGLVTEGVRWGVCAASRELWLITAVQVFHGVAVAGILVGAALYVERSVPPGLRSTGQALVSMAGAGGGAILSNAAAGWWMEKVSVEAPYWIAAAGCAVLAVSLRRILEPPQRLEV